MELLSMILAVDVAYAGETARVAGVWFEGWEAEKATGEMMVEVSGVAEYVPGEFYKRELPCVAKLLERVEVGFECIVIDGYVTLGVERRAGLGMHLWAFLGKRVAVVGVAKTAFAGTPAEAEVLRGGSGKPLYVTAVGMALAEAKAGVRGMRGEHRIPAMLKRVDRLSRGS